MFCARPLGRSNKWTQVRWLSSSFHVRIVTGNLRGAGTSAQVFLSLIGDQATSPLETIPGRFRRKSIVDSKVLFDEDIGNIQKLHIGHDNIGDLGVGWYLDHVVVEDLKANKEYKFVAQRWLGVSDVASGSGPPSIELDVFEDSQPQVVDEEVNVPFSFQHGSFTIPHPQKTAKGGERGVVKKWFGHAGEDAYALASIPNQHHPGHNCLLVAVADGIHSWRKHGIDAGLFSRGLVQAMVDEVDTAHCNDNIDIDTESAAEATAEYEREIEAMHDADVDAEYASEVTPISKQVVEDVRNARQLVRKHSMRNSCGGEFGKVTSWDLMETAERHVKDQGLSGSSTACVAILHPVSHHIDITNLGDCGVRVVRNGKVVHRTEEMDHSFGHPYQLGHHKEADSTLDSETVRWGLHRNDVIVIGSDGLFDNLSDERMEEHLRKVWPATVDGAEAGGKLASAGPTASSLAQAFTYQAFDMSVQRREDTPYSTSATAFHNMIYHGGKQDDITVVVIKVV